MHALPSMFAKTALVLSIALGAFAAVGCSQSVDAPSGGSTPAGGGADYGSPTPSAAAADACATPAEGCPCSDLGTKVTCKTTEARVGGYAICGGDRTCERDTGLWGACVPSVNLGGSTGDAGTTAASSPTH